MNRKLSIISMIIAAAFLAATALSSGAQEMLKVKTNAGFEQLKSLVGTWEGTNAAGQPVRVEYQVVSNGSALLERLHPMNDMEMVTMYSADGDRVAVTHYCNVGNQPQMQTGPVSASTQKFTFNFVRATNLASSSAGHMDNLTATLQDRDHFTQEWNFVENGKVTHSETFHFTRKS